MLDAGDVIGRNLPRARALYGKTSARAAASPPSCKLRSAGSSRRTRTAASRPSTCSRRAAPARTPAACHGGRAGLGHGSRATKALPFYHRGRDRSSVTAACERAKKIAVVAVLPPSRRPRDRRSPGPCRPSAAGRELPAVVDRVEQESCTRVPERVLHGGAPSMTKRTFLVPAAFVERRDPSVEPQRRSSRRPTRWRPASPARLRLLRWDLAHLDQREAPPPTAREQPGRARRAVRDFGSDGSRTPLRDRLQDLHELRELLRPLLPTHSSRLVTARLPAFRQHRQRKSESQSQIQRALRTVKLIRWRPSSGCTLVRERPDAVIAPQPRGSAPHHHVAVNQPYGLLAVGAAIASEEGRRPAAQQRPRRSAPSSRARPCPGGG